ncbi:hypothetical protein Q2941_14895 [Bradyrhizobium sp. UFLA05-153]
MKSRDLQGTRIDDCSQASSLLQSSMPPLAVGERITEPPLSLDEFFAALWAETEKSPKIVSEEVAAAQSWQACRSRRDAIIAERGRLYEASKRLVAREMVKISPTTTLEDYVKRRDARKGELEEARLHWWRTVDEMWPVPPTELEQIMSKVRWGWWVAIIAALSFFRITVTPISRSVVKGAAHFFWQR